MKKLLLILLVSMFAVSCSTLRDAANVQEPNVSFKDMSIDRITPDGVTLLFDFEVDNPNSFGVSASGYNYEFFINESSFLSGVEEDNFSIGRESKQTVQVPVTLNFQEVYDSFRSVIRQDSLSYAIATEVEFEVPVLGTRKVPVRTSGELPIPKVPRISLGDFDVKNISLSGAEIEVSFQVENPNPFAISIANTAYELAVNGREWLDTTLGENIRIGASDRQTITIPIRLNSSQMGSALMDIMSGNTSFEYDLKGSADISADLQGFRDGQTFPFDLSGTYRLD
ncbi:LEA type 2 family protein [Rhodohalobacter halophilus]|uniref:LEA type 2 family protein n=1 Tax=Rhodohalobacter halophilus TaxID=1812810 RepID=UPI000A0703E7|nr:LEA type 2 family protein [Rhodohalobacter halophilus]